MHSHDRVSGCSWRSVTLLVAGLVVLLFPVWAAAQQSSISLEKTVGVNPAECATTSSIVLPIPGGDVTYCYEVTNTGDISLTFHDLVDDQLGTLLVSYVYTLSPGSSFYFLQDANIQTSSPTQTQLTVVNSATWTANPPTFGPVSSTDQATVTVQQIASIPTLMPTARLLIVALICGAGLILVRRLA